MNSEKLGLGNFAFEVGIYVITKDDYLDHVLTIDEETLQAGLSAAQDALPAQVFAGEENIGYVEQLHQGCLKIRIHPNYSELVTEYTGMVYAGAGAKVDISIFSLTK